MDEPGGFDSLIFEQELNEVYLLLDFISGRPDHHLTDLDGKISDPARPPGDPDRKLSSSEIVERVSALRFPPTPAPGGGKDRSAAFLLLLKDALNTLAYPARGLTIAYTVLFTGEGAKDHRFASEAGKKATPRINAAQLAFPGLTDSANSFRKVKNVMAWSGLAITVMSALFLWQVTYGAQLAARFDEAKRNDSQTAAKVYEQMGTERTATGQPLPDLAKACRIALPPVPGGLPDDTRSATMRQLCDDYAYRHAQLCVSVADVGKFGQSWPFAIARSLLPIHALQPTDGCSGESAIKEYGRQEDAQSIAGVLAMMSNYLLPILFGLAGTMASLVRGIQDKVRESVLEPRDRALSLIRLPLGMVAGVSVGLFLTPTSVAAQTGGSVGAFTVSASGIAFLAGYGAEGFFRALDSLITHVFSLGERHPAKPTGTTS